MSFTALRSSSDSSPFFTLTPPDFFTPPFARRPVHRTLLVLLSWPVGGGSSWTCSRRERISITPHAMWGGAAPNRQPRHAGWKIEPDGRYAAEELAVCFLWVHPRDRMGMPTPPRGSVAAGIGASTERSEVERIARRRPQGAGPP